MYRGRGGKLNEDVKNIKHYLEKLPDVEIWVVSGNKIQAELYWKKIANELNEKRRKPRFISSKINSIDGLNSQNALILLCGRWWTNPATDTYTFKFYLKNAKIAISIGEL